MLAFFSLDDLIMVHERVSTVAKDLDLLAHVGRLDAPFVAEVVVEEGAELSGWGVIVTGLAAWLLDSRLRAP